MNAVVEQLKIDAGYSGKSEQWRYGFDLACRELQKRLAFPDVLSVGEELQSWVSVQSFAVQCEEGKYPFGKPVVDANEIAEMIEQLTGAKS